MKIRPLSRSIILVGIIFFAVLTLVLSITTYRIFTGTMYARNESQMTEILDYIVRMVDIDDLAGCARTYEESPKYIQFQHFMDVLADYYSRDVDQIYVVQISAPGKTERARAICVGATVDERIYGRNSIVHLGDVVENRFSPELADQFYAVQLGSKDVFLFNSSPKGQVYTLARPLISSFGDHYAVLCIDIAIDEINALVSKNIFINIGVIILAGLIFIILVILWLHAKVVQPLKSLESSVSAYADKAANQNDPDQLIYDPPKLRVRNEIRALAEEVQKLSDCMQGYVRRILDAKNETRDLKQQVYKDSLTLVKNKAAYDVKAENLEKIISKGHAEFGIVMADLNNLKKINDTYGHEHGNEYIIGGCQLVCDTYTHSPVYRVGGDEFVVVLLGKDYKNRNALIAKLKRVVYKCTKDTEVPPWQQYSLAVGMSIYQEGDDVDSVFRRADKAMYEEKLRMKSRASEDKKIEAENRLPDTDKSNEESPST